MSHPAPITNQRERLDGRYELFEEIAVGGMATVQLGRLVSRGGFTKPVAIKRVHRHLVGEPEFIEMFLDEARLAARVRHPNVVPTLDVVQRGEEVCLVLDYVEGEALSKLLRAAWKAGYPVAPELIASVMIAALYGLAAAHEAKDEQGEPLNIVHRDVSPQNIMVGVDGIARVLDFGVAKGSGRVQSTRDGQLKGKLRYMSPEQARGEAVTAGADLYAAGVVLYEALTGQRLVNGDSEIAQLSQVLEGAIPKPSDADPALAPFDAIIARALDKDPSVRYASARDMARELEAAVRPMSNHEVGEWVATIAAVPLADRAAKVRRMEQAALGEVSSITVVGALTPGATGTSAGVVVVPPPEPAKRKSVLWIAAGVCGVCLVGLAVGARWLTAGPATGSGQEAEATLPALAAPTDATEATPAAATTATQEAPEEAAEAAPEPTVPAAADEAVAAKAPVAAAQRPAPRAEPKAAAEPKPAPERSAEPKPAPEPAPAPAAKPAVDCSSPFWVDAKGIKRVKPECAK